MRIAFDSSALFKRYSPEAGRDQVVTALRRASSVSVGPHLRLELMASAERLLRDRLITEEQYGQLVGQVTTDLSAWDVVPFSRPVEEASLRALRVVRVRAMDALHVGAAVIARVDLFVTADRRQAESARAMNLATELVEVV